MADTDPQIPDQTTDLPPTPSSDAPPVEPNSPPAAQNSKLPQPVVADPSTDLAASPLPQTPQNYPPTAKDQDIQQAEELSAPAPFTSQTVPSTDPTLQPSNSQTLPHEAPLQEPQSPAEQAPTRSPLQMKEDIQFPQNAEPSNAATQTPQEAKEPFLSYPTEPQSETTSGTPVPIPQPMPNSNEPEPIPTSISPPQPVTPPPPTSPPTSPTSSPDQPTVKAKGHGVRNFLLVLLVILFLGGSAGGGFWAYKTYLTQASTPSTQTPIEPQLSQNELPIPKRDESGFVLGESIQNFTVYSDLENNFSIEIPQDWKVLSAQKAGLAADFTSPDGAFNLIVKNPQVVDDNQLLDTQTQELRDTIAAETANLQLGDTKRILVNSLAANRFEATEKENDQTFQAVYLLIFKDNKIFTIKAYGPQQTFSLQNQTIERTLASFK